MAPRRPQADVTVTASDPAVVVTVRWIGPEDRSSIVTGRPACDHETDAQTAADLLRDYPDFYALAAPVQPEPVPAPTEAPPA